MSRVTADLTPLGGAPKQELARQPVGRVPTRRFCTMPNHRRNYKKGGTYFFTIVTGNRAKILCGEMVGLLRACFKDCMQLTPFPMDAIVVLPDHVHCLWTLPDGDDNYSLRWKNIKASFTKSHICEAMVTETQTAEPLKKRAGKLFGSSGFGNTQYGMTEILDSTAIISTTTL